MDHIILHVTYTCLPGKAEDFVRTLKERGFDFLTISALAEQQGISLEPGVCYRSFSADSG